MIWVHRGPDLIPCSFDNRFRVAQGMTRIELAQEQATLRSQGWRVLIVEDEFLLADDLAKAFRKADIDIVGPTPSRSQALALIAQKNVTTAVLDISLDGDNVYEVADALIERDVPILFVTGYDRSDIPSRYAEVPICQKPIGADAVIAALERIVPK